MRSKRIRRRSSEQWLGVELDIRVLRRAAARVHLQGPAEESAAEAQLPEVPRRPGALPLEHARRLCNLDSELVFPPFRRQRVNCGHSLYIGSGSTSERIQRGKVEARCSTAEVRLRRFEFANRQIIQANRESTLILLTT